MFIWNTYCGFPNTSLKRGETLLEVMGTLKPLPGTDLPIQALPKALQGAGVPDTTKNVAIFLGLEVRKQWVQAVVEEARDGNEYLVI